jgi:hypothetical protein
VVSESGTSTTTTATHVHRCDAPIVFLTATSAKKSNPYPDQALPGYDVVAVAADGTILSLHGETLEKKWQSAPAVFAQELSSASSVADFRVDYVQSSLAADVIDGIFGGKSDLFGVFQEKVHREGFNPDILIAITSFQDTATTRRRHLHILAFPEARVSRQGTGQNIIPLFVSPFPTDVSPSKYQLDVKSGALQELANDVLYSYAITGGIPRLETQLPVPGLKSFVRLSKTSVLAATPEALSIYNPAYRSLQTTTAVDNETFGGPPAASGQQDACDLFLYLAGREMAVGLRGASLIAVQVEAPRTRGLKRRADGLLVDAIRRGISGQPPCSHSSEHISAAILEEPLPGSLSETYWTEWQQKSAEADELFEVQNLPGFEELLAGVFKIETAQPDKANGVRPSKKDAAKSVPKSTWLPPSGDYPQVDRRWVLYAIGKVFTWNDKAVGDAEVLQLACALPESNVLSYLVNAGHLSTSNIKSAFNAETLEMDDVDNVIGEELPQLLASVDPTLELLTSYLSVTMAGSVELTASIKLLLGSLGLLQNASSGQELQTIADTPVDGGDDSIMMELDRAEEELQITEYYLGNESDSRARGLSVAFSKLAACPAAHTVQSLRRLFKPDEVICLINILRMELIKDGWTTRYLDGPADAEEEADTASNESIQLISNLLCRCLDSVGLGGWMGFDMMLTGGGGGDQDDDAVDFFGQFQAEVSVALEGIFEAVRLQGSLSEAVGYANRARAAAAGAHLSKGSAVRSQALPFGLKTDAPVSADRVRSGGEVVARSRRQMGLFQSKKQKAYSVTRISEETLQGRLGAVVVKQEGGGM